MNILNAINGMSESARAELKLKSITARLNELKNQLGYKPVASPSGPRLTVRCKNKRRFNPAEHSGMYIHGPRMAKVNLPVNRVKFMDAE